MPTTTATNGKLSVQPRFDARQMTDASAYLWTFFDRFTSENTIPEWGNPSRVDKLREFARQEPILVGALSSMTSKAVSLDWQITGGRNRVTRYQEILAEADAGAGWSFFLDRLLQDYWQADQGGFVELGRHGKNGPVLGVYNLDAGTMQLLASPKTPAAYYPRLITGAVSGKRIPLEPSDYTRIVDMPTPDESKAGLGFCATSRALKVAQVLMALYNYEEERLSDMPLPGIAAITGMTQSEVRSAFELYKAHREDKQQTTFKGVLWLAAQSSPINPIGVNLTSFSSLPEGFDKKTTIELYVYTLALDFGVDVREFWPASQTGATKAEAEVQAQKAKGKGFGRALSSVERMVNWDILPEGLEFVFDQKDSEDDLLRETIREKVIANIATLAGGQLISPDEARRWLVELEMAPEWLAETNMTTVHGNANTDEEAPEVVEREEPPPAEQATPPAAEQATPPAVDQAVAEKARRARLEPGEDFVAINGAGDVVTLWSSRRVFAMGEKKFNPDQPRVPAGQPEGGQWSEDGGGTVMPRNAKLYMRSNRPFTGPNGSKLVAYEHKTVEDLAYNEHEGYYSKQVSDWDNAGKCATCGRKIVHVYFVEHADGKIATYGSEHLWQALGYRDDQWMDTRQVNKLRNQLVAEQNAWQLNLEEAHEKVTARASNDIQQVNRKFRDLGGRGLKAEETSLMERDDGMMVRVFGPYQITAAAQQGYRPRVVGSGAREDDRRRFAELFGIEKTYDPSQPRWPAGDERGGQWRPEGGQPQIAGAPARLDEFTDADTFMRLMSRPGLTTNVSMAITEREITREGQFPRTTVDIMVTWTDPEMPDFNPDFYPGSARFTLVKGATGEVVLESFDYKVFTQKNGLREIDWEYNDRIWNAIGEPIDLGWKSPHQVRVSDLAPLPGGETFSMTEKSLRFDEEWMRIKQMEKDELNEFFVRRYGVSLPYPEAATSESFRQYIKWRGENSLAADGVSSAEAARVQTAWATSAHDNGDWQDVIHVVAAEKSGEKDDLVWFDGMTAAQARRGDALAGNDSVKTFDEGARAYQSVYRRTQEYLQSKRIKPDDTLVLYRGMWISDASPVFGSLKDMLPGDKIRVKPRPLSSFSLSHTVAKSFGPGDAMPGQYGVTFAVRVPAKAVFSHWSTGFGCADEEEMIVLGEYLNDAPWEIVEIKDRTREKARRASASLAPMLALVEDDYNANWLVELQRQKKARLGTPTDLDLARGDAFILGDAEKRFDPGQPRWPEGDPRGGQWRPEGGAAQAGAGQEAPAEPTPAKQARQARPNLPTQQADELIASLRQATAALLEAEKAFDPDQPRWPAGDERGGQWRPEGGGTTAAANAQLDITTGDINAMRADMGLPPVPPPEPEAGRRGRTSTSRKVKNLGGGINTSILLEDENGTRWVWKPVRGESGQDGNSEVAAYEIAQVLGMDCVPPTRYEEFEGALGTAQQFVDGTLGAEWTARYGSQTALDILPRATEDVVVLDFIIDNYDRHTANWIVGEDRVWAIDNGGANWTSNEGNESNELYWNTLVNYWLARKPGKLRISPEKLERWSRITKEEFLGAFRDVPEFGETKVNPENAWSNFQSITKSGLVAWREWDGPSALSLPAVSEAPAAPPVDDDTEEALRQAQRAPWPLFREWSY